jgi:hypothetical protein
MTTDDKEEKKYAKIRKLCDTIGGSSSTEKQRKLAWEQLLPIASDSTLTSLIAAKYSWLEFSDEYKELAWQELLKQKVKDNLSSLHYLSVNAPEPWCTRSRILEEKLEEKLSAKKR